MPRPIIDTPALLHETGQREKEGMTWSVLSLEAQLWVEVSLLIVLGVIMIYSSSSIMAMKKFGDAAHYLKRQLFCVCLGVGIMSLVRRVPYGYYNGPVSWAFYGAVASLALVLVPGIGVELNNARRWFQFKSFLLQPAEFAKVIWMIYLSVSLFKKQDRIKQAVVSFWPHMILCGVLSALLLMQPDFGTTFMIAVLTVIMLAVGGSHFRHLFILIPVGMAGFYKFVYQVPYRWERVTAFWNPWTDRLDSGYQLIQAWIAVGSGGVFGKGLGAGQQKLFYLPESYTDFILAVIGEELGFAGILLVCALFFFLFQTGLRISRNAPDFLGTLMALGLTMLLTLQAMVNMGVVLGLLPTKGLPLPFISYGGSAFTANCLAAGILMNIARSSERRVG